MDVDFRPDTGYGAHACRRNIVFCVTRLLLRLKKQMTFPKALP